MSRFVKFPSIRENWVDHCISNPEFQNGDFAVTEKIDGANLQFYFDKSQPMRVGKRSGFIKPKADFFNVWGILATRKEELKRLSNYASEQNLVLRVYGELYGQEVIKRIDYQTPGEICFFQAEVNNVRLSYAEMLKLFEELQVEHLMVPLLGKYSIKDALQLPVIFPSKLNPAENAEGFVISGWKSTFTERAGKPVPPFLLKMKNPDFADVEGGTGTNPEYVPIVGYINRNRIYSVMSKTGNFTDKRLIGEYVDQTMQEITDDFEKDHGHPSPVPVEKFKGAIGHLVVQIMKEHD